MAAEVSHEVAIRATDPERIGQALAAASGQTRFPQTLRREGYGIASGDAGLAVLCAAYDREEPDAGWDRAGHGFLTTAARSAERAHVLPPALFGGLSGLAFAAHGLNREGQRYARLLATLDAALARDVVRLTASVDEEDPVPMGHFDVISGLSGIVAYLLCRDEHRMLPRALRSLTRLAEPLPGLPRWFTPVELVGDEVARARYPYGNLNCGLAHGIPGPLAALALALAAGHEVKGQGAAVRSLAAWLADQRTEDAWGVDWPGAISVSKAGLPEPSAATAGRAGWCYGGPGVARALWHAGQALDDGYLRGLALDGVLAAVRRPVEIRGIPSPTLCHGVAGLLQIVLRFLHDTGHPELSFAADALMAQLLTLHDPDRPLGYAALEPGPNPVDRGGLLDGAAGVSLALLAATSRDEPSWDRLFLLS